MFRRLPIAGHHLDVLPSRIVAVSPTRSATDDHGVVPGLHQARHQVGADVARAADNHHAHATNITVATTTRRSFAALTTPAAAGPGQSLCRTAGAVHRNLSGTAASHAHVGAAVATTGTDGTRRVRRVRRWWPTCPSRFGLFVGGSGNWPPLVKDAYESHVLLEHRTEARHHDCHKAHQAFGWTPGYQPRHCDRARGPVNHLPKTLQCQVPPRSSCFDGSFFVPVLVLDDGSALNEPDEIVTWAKGTRGRRRSCLLRLHGRGTGLNRWSQRCLLCSWESSWSTASAGVFHPRVLRGRPLRVAATASRSSVTQQARSVTLGKY
jgi:hypothetical protein